MRQEQPLNDGPGPTDFDPCRPELRGRGLCRCGGFRIPVLDMSGKMVVRSYTAFFATINSAMLLLGRH